MDVLIVATAAFAASALTLISGFGLATVLMPVFALFFPIQTAIAATAIVHLANNLFKLALVGRHADWRVVVHFGVPAAVTAFAGAGAMVLFAELPAIAHYELFGRAHTVTPIKLVIGVLIAGFALLELSARTAQLAIPPRYLPLGGIVSGFFGGISGHQGALRSAFLIKAGLDKDAFVATGVVVAVIVDCARLLVYGASYLGASFTALTDQGVVLVIVASIAAFWGAYLSARVLKKLTLRNVRIIVAVLMMAVGAGLALGVI